MLNTSTPLEPTVRKQLLMALAFSGLCAAVSLSNPPPSNSVTSETWRKEDVANNTKSRYVLYGKWTMDANIYTRP